VLALAATITLFAAWPRLVAWGAELRERHRWGVAVCHVGDEARLCQWRPTIPAPGEGVSGVRGVWNGVGLKLSTAIAAAATDVDVPPGKYRVSLRADTAVPGPGPEIRLTLSARNAPLAEATLPLPAGTPPTLVVGTIEHLGGLLNVEVKAERLWTTPTLYDLPPVWVSDLKIEAEFH
jgi:hypothetical protein